MSYYQRHIFFCINDRGPDSDRPSCNNCGSAEIRVNQAGCLDRCEEGPVCVVYPEGIWYTYVDEFDVDEIIKSHLLKGEPVERLKI